MQAIEACDNKMLKIAFHLAFTATLRMGEILGLRGNFEGGGCREPSVCPCE